MSNCCVCMLAVALGKWGVKDRACVLFLASFSTIYTIQMNVCLFFVGRILIPTSIDPACDYWESTNCCNLTWVPVDGYRWVPVGAMRVLFELGGCSI